LNCTAIK